MSYIDKFGFEDFDYLDLHEEGFKCWQTDYRLLRERNEEADKIAWEGGEKDFKDTCMQRDKDKQVPRQRPLFSKEQLANWNN
ncbi:hypothetical protein [Maribacter sp. Asnod2-G09]|uniref:hypothetical protein n=1 Tax=Maribacter sp. Asnod2-G09 TaxID=3160577 RepID=UPI0038672E9E